jgi:mRNA interferase MazF
VRRGEIWWADIPEPIASEPGYRHPVVIIQADEINLTRINTVIVIELTSNMRLARLHGNIKVSAVKTGLPKDSVANVSQLTSLDKRFLDEKIGEVDRLTMRQIDEGLRIILSL